MKSAFETDCAYRRLLARLWGGMSGTFWAVRRPARVAGGLVVAVVAVTVWLLWAKSGVNTATVLSLSVSVLSLAVAVWGLVPATPFSRAARELADRVAQERGRARRQALGMAGDARPANTAFRAPAPDEEPELLRWRSDGGVEEGTLSNVAAYYRSLDRGRLVVLGEPGAGKTVLVTQLVIDLLEGLPDGELRPGARPPVPVWVTLTSVDLGEVDSLAHTDAEELADRLDRQVAAQIAATYQISKTVAERLIEEHWVLPVLDGLDEMDASEPAASGPVRPRAEAVVRALNAGTGRRPVVMACRRGEYGQLARSAGGWPEEPALQDARQIILQPLDVPAICDYLARRFPSGHAGQPSPRWETVKTALEDPSGTGRGAVLTSVLSSPWGLFLAATAYQDEASDPGELLRKPADELGEHLLSQLIPAVTRRAAGAGGRHYQPEQVHIWLRSLAVHLEQTSNDPELRWSPTDLRLDRLWRIGSEGAVLIKSLIANLVVVGAASSVFDLWLEHSDGEWYHEGPVGRTASVALTSGFMCWLALLFYDPHPSSGGSILGSPHARAAGS